MATLTLPKDLALAHHEDEPILISGPPTGLSGRLRLHNGAAEKVTLSRLQMDIPKLMGPARRPVAELRLSARLHPGEQDIVPASLRVDPATPPGRYEGFVQVNGRRQSVVVQITEVTDLRVHPTYVALYTEGELDFPREFVVENAGNVPLPLGEKCLAPLVDTATLSSVLRRGLEGAGDKAPQDVLKALLGALADQQVGLVSLTREPLVLQPGETRVETGTFHLPPDLKSFRRYRADMELYAASLHLDVYVGQLPKERGPSPKRTPT